MILKLKHTNLSQKSSLPKMGTQLKGVRIKVCCKRQRYTYKNQLEEKVFAAVKIGTSVTTLPKGGNS